MKMIYRLLLLILFASTLLTCKKIEDSYHCDGVVLHYFTKKPIAGIGVWVVKEKDEWFGGSDYTLIGQTVTDNNGEFSIKLTMRPKSHKYIIDIVSTDRGDCDTNKLENQYFRTHYYRSNYSDAKVEYFEFLLKPMGLVTAYWNNKQLDSLQADSLIINSPYETFVHGGYRPRTVIYEPRFYCEPMKVNHFTWFYYKDGIKSKEYSKDMYVSNWNKNPCRGGPDTKLQITF